MKTRYFTRRQIFCQCFLAMILIVSLSPVVSGRPVPDNGVVREYYTNGHIHLEFRYKNGYLVQKRYWYKNGHLMADYRYKQGAPYKKVNYYENGRLKSIWTRKTGILRSYYDDGRFKAVVNSNGLY